MNNFFERPRILPIFSIAFFGFVTIVMYSSCKSQTAQNHQYGPVFNDSSVLVWAKPGKSEEFKDAILKFIQKNTVNANYCKSCDSNLILLTGTNVATELVGQLASGGSTSGGTITPHGDGDPLGYYSANFELGFDDAPKENKQDSATNLNLPPSKSEPVLVAVLDSGVDSANLQRNKLLFHGTTNSCVGKRGVDGWNFPDNNQATNDDYLNHGGHGNIVSRIIVEKVKAVNDDHVQILPVKVINSSGKGKLFDMLCGIAYAKERGASIVNASLGFYPLREVDSSVLLMKEFIRYHLTSNHILLIAAGGNGSSDLLVKPFFPAKFSFDSTMDNVIAVNTVAIKNPGTGVSPHQNYSSSVVDAGVNADQVDGQKFEFVNPMNNSLVEGSSFATPVVTAIIAAKYNFLKTQISSSGQQLNRFTIFPVLITGNFVKNVNNLRPFIKEGKATHNRNSF